MQLGAWRSSDEEKRHLRLRVYSLKKGLESQRKARKQLELENKQLAFALKEAQERIRKLEDENDKIQRQRDRYRNMVFKSSKQDPENDEQEQVMSIQPVIQKKRKRGGQKGHRGHGRKRPEQVDEVIRIYETLCPYCHEEIARSRTIEEHTIEDIPQLEKTHKRTTSFEIEVQWCPRCKKTIKGKVNGVIPGSRLGLNTMLYVLLQKYVSRCSWEIIEKNLEIFYGLKVSRGAMVDMMHRVRRWLGPQYDEIIQAIRSSRVKYADETSWAVEKIGHWLWGFFTNQHAFYTIAESRGKGIPKKILAGSHPRDVLVRDDYAGYTKLALRHQSCWAHLLRICREDSSHPNASLEIKGLHQELKDIFAEINQIIQTPFVLGDRKAKHKLYKAKIKKIIKAKYQHKDTNKIQTRIRNQNENLLTALLNENVPLTNNLAERNLRPLVVIRKISGECKSQNGTLTLAVIMSILQTLRMQDKSLILSLKNAILNASLKT